MTCASRRSSSPSRPTPSCRTADGALSVADQRYASRGRARGRAQERRPQHPDRKGARLHLRLRRRHRPHPARSADRLARHQAAVGSRQGVRSFGALWPDRPAAEIGHPAKGRITLKVNGKVRQDGNLDQMIWNVPEIISKLSEMVELAAGDIIMTGTPSGVAATVAGDKIECEIEGVGKLHVTIGEPLK